MQVRPHSAISNKKTTDTCASPVPLNSIPNFGFAVQRNDKYIVQICFCVYQQHTSPPATKKSNGKPPTKRIRSVGEFGVPGSKSQSHKSSRCGIGGHNKSTCKTAI
ncbi:hypothetical protein F2Q68_00031922 [Brassica cretica]|uniref:Uncharacterized protein n=1 Tax=Brassica cretica TaxID=69181 RepID=A0A8S9G6U0_BRACR|nr:hypothetical protein F2Q68_00031922 [Brassica cretica]